MFSEELLNTYNKIISKKRVKIVKPPVRIDKRGKNKKSKTFKIKNELYSGWDKPDFIDIDNSKQWYIGWDEPDFIDIINSKKWKNRIITDETLQFLEDRNKRRFNNVKNYYKNNY